LAIVDWLISDRGLPIVDIADCQLRIADCGLPIVENLRIDRFPSE
jgi:hypothetical protein